MDFSPETLQARREWDDIFKVLKERKRYSNNNKLPTKNALSDKADLSTEGELRDLPEKQSWRISLQSAAAAKSLQSCPTLCDPIDGSPPGSPFPGILQARTLERLPFPCPMHETEKRKWSRSVVSDSLLPRGLQPTRLLHSWGFPGKSTGVGCHCLLRLNAAARGKKLVK